jgi:Domain of unknown function (DUF4148)
MKAFLIALTWAASAAATSVYAAVPAAPVQPDADAQKSLQQLPANAEDSRITRAQVRQELARAQKDGELAATKAMYSGH